MGGMLIVPLCGNDTSNVLCAILFSPPPHTLALYLAVRKLSFPITWIPAVNIELPLRIHPDGDDWWEAVPPIFHNDPCFMFVELLLQNQKTLFQTRFGLVYKVFLYSLIAAIANFDYSSFQFLFRKMSCANSPIHILLACIAILAGHC